MLFPPEHYQTIMPIIQAGAANAGRAVDDIDVGACIWCSIADDRSKAEDALKAKIAYYGYALSPMILDQLQLTHADFEPIAHAVVVENDLQRAKAMITESMMRIGISSGRVSRMNRSFGCSGVRVSNSAFSWIFSGAWKLTVSTRTSAKNFSLSCGGRICPWMACWIWAT